MITGFKAKIAVDDAGTGAAPGGASTVFTGVTMIELPGLEAGKFDATELNQVVSGSTFDPYERELPTGAIKMGAIKAEFFYTKANYQRLQAMLAVRGYTWLLTLPDDLTGGETPVTMTVTATAFLSKLGDLKFEKGTPIKIPVEITLQKQPTVA